MASVIVTNRPFNTCPLSTVALKRMRACWRRPCFDTNFMLSMKIVLNNC